MFETIAFRQNTLEYFDEHMARLHSAASYFNLSSVPSAAQLKRATLELLDTIKPRTNYRIRVTVSRLGTSTDVTIGYARLEPVDAAPRTLVLTDILRPAGNPTARFKTLAYTDHLDAQRGLAAGQEALLLNQWGRVACSAFANVYAYVDGVWITPSVSEGALPGIIRGQVLAKAEQVLGVGNLQGQSVIEGQITLGTFSEAPLLMSNSLRGLVACRLAPRSTGSGQQGA